MTHFSQTMQYTNIATQSYTAVRGLVESNSGMSERCCRPPPPNQLQTRIGPLRTLAPDTVVPPFGLWGNQHRVLPALLTEERSDAVRMLRRDPPLPLANPEAFTRIAAVFNTFPSSYRRKTPFAELVLNYETLACFILPVVSVSRSAKVNRTRLVVLEELRLGLNSAFFVRDCHI